MTKISQALTLFRQKLSLLLGRCYPMELKSIPEEIGKLNQLIGENTLQHFNDIYGNGGQVIQSTQKQETPILITPLQDSASSLLTSPGQLEKMIGQINEWKVNDFVFCSFIDQTGSVVQSFGVITNINGDYYVINLFESLKWASVPLEALKLAGRC